jgi:predicted DNA-binding protein (MmcQ/YjbR family)
MAAANSLAFKLDSPTADVLARLDHDPRITATHMGEARWFTFELSSDSDLRGALGWLEEAYDVAGKNKKSK